MLKTDFIKKSNQLQGKLSEIYLRPKIEHKFKTKFKMTHYHHPFDFISENIYIELKTRNNNYNKYPTTMIGHNKLIKARELKNKNIKTYFFFRFTDGIYYIRYTDKLLDNIKSKIGGRFDRGCKELNLYSYIPIDQLKRLE